MSVAAGYVAPSTALTTHAPSAGSGDDTSATVAAPLGSTVTFTFTMPFAVDFVPHALTSGITALIAVEIDARSSCPDSGFAAGSAGAGASDEAGAAVGAAASAVGAGAGDCGAGLG